MAALASETVPVQIDEDLHSRQLAVYGRESMGRMANSNILILGALGLGIETGKSTLPCPSWRSQRACVRSSLYL